MIAEKNHASGPKTILYVSEKGTTCSRTGPAKTIHAPGAESTCSRFWAWKNGSRFWGGTNIGHAYGAVPSLDASGDLAHDLARPILAPESKLDY